MRIGRVRTLADCHNVADFRELARRRLPFPVFHYIDGGGDDEATKKRNTAAFDDVDLVPDVLVNVESIDTRPRRFELLDLTTGGKFEVPDAASFKFSKGSKFVAVRANKASSSSKHDGADLVLRELATSVT